MNNLSSYCLHNLFFVLTFRTIYVHNMFWACNFHVLNLYIIQWYIQSSVILWVSWCKNKCFWNRFTCKSCAFNKFPWKLKLLTFLRPVPRTATTELAVKNTGLKNILLRIRLENFLFSNDFSRTFFRKYNITASLWPSWFEIASCYLVQIMWIST